MSFESFFEAQSFFLWGAFLLALVMGAVVNKTNFCTMGAVSDMVNMGDYSRFRTWLLAIAVAMVGVVVLEYLGAVDADSTFPPYRASQLIWAENILGGFLFGIGMTFASGCGNKTLVRIGGGNIKSIFVLAIIGVIAFYMANPLPGSDQTLFSALFYDWMRPLAIDLDTSSDLGSIISAENPLLTRLIIGGVVALVLLTYIFKSADFRSEKDNVIGGVVVGLAVLGAWYLSSNVVINAEDELYSLSSYYEEWDMLSEDEEGKPSVGRPLSSQSFTFINPMGQTFGYVASGLNNIHLTFGIVSLLGIILGSLLWSIVSKSFRIEWFVNIKDMLNHALGAVLMGFGGVLALGCTIGQGITGISTLAIGSILVFVSIIYGSALTMKVQYYGMLYEDSSFLDRLLTALVELKTLPSGMRKLEAL